MLLLAACDELLARQCDRILLGPFTAELQHLVQQLRVKGEFGGHGALRCVTRCVEVYTDRPASADAEGIVGLAPAQAQGHPAPCGRSGFACLPAHSSRISATIDPTGSVSSASAT